jgi:uncharacterized protein YbjT (DUF2867 family)
MPKLIVVFGATGNQGGSVVRQLLAKGFKVRGVTRSTSSEKAKAIISNGVEMVEADVNDKSSLAKAYAGDVSGAFLVTNFWESGGYEVELQQGKNMADAAISAKIPFIVFSSLVGFKEPSGGQYNVAHFDSKSEIEKYIVSSGLKAAFVQPGMYMQALKLAFRPERNKETNKVSWTFPMRADVDLPLLDVHDYGKWVAPVFEEPDKFVGKHILAAPNYVLPEEIVRSYESHAGEKVEVSFVSASVISSAELRDMIEAFSRFGYYCGKSLDETKRLLPDLKVNSLSDWFKQENFQV